MKQRPRIYYTQDQKALMWERWRKGDSLQQIAQLFDRIPAMEPAQTQCFGGGIPAGAQGEQAEGMVFFIFNN